MTALRSSTPGVTRQSAKSMASLFDRRRYRLAAEIASYHAGVLPGGDRYPLAETEVRSAWRPLIRSMNGGDADPFLIAYQLTHMDGERDELPPATPLQVQR